MSRVRIEGAGSYAAANSSVFRCALKVVTVAELFATGDREFQRANLGQSGNALLVLSYQYCEFQSSGR